MYRTVSATEARIHFGEIMRQAKAGPVIVERDGKPEVVVISKQHYDTLAGHTSRNDWRKLLDELHDRLSVELAGRTLPEPEEIIRQGREERDAQLLDNLR